MQIPQSMFAGGRVIGQNVSGEREQPLAPAQNQGPVSPNASFGINPYGGGKKGTAVYMTKDGPVRTGPSAPTVFNGTPPPGYQSQFPSIPLADLMSGGGSGKGGDGDCDCGHGGPGGIPGFARGGTLRRSGEMAIVGEEGPELMLQHSRGTSIIPLASVPIPGLNIRNAQQLDQVNRTQEASQYRQRSTANFQDSLARSRASKANDRMAAADFSDAVHAGVPDATARQQAYSTRQRGQANLDTGNYFAEQERAGKMLPFEQAALVPVPGAAGRSTGGTQQRTSSYGGSPLDRAKAYELLKESLGDDEARRIAFSGQEGMPLTGQNAAPATQPATQPTTQPAQAQVPMPGAESTAATAQPAQRQVPLPSRFQRGRDFRGKEGSTSPASNCRRCTPATEKTSTGPSAWPRNMAARIPTLPPTAC
jgi:hypothetical protein